MFLYLVILNGVAESFRHVMGTLHMKELSIKKFFSKPSMTFKKEFYEILKEGTNKEHTSQNIYRRYDAPSRFSCNLSTGWVVLYLTWAI